MRGPSLHILFLTDNFPPEVNAPASRTFEHCREWVRAGHRVTVITGAPNFPSGKVFPGYQNRLWQREELAGIEVVRVWTYITANEGFVKRTLDYVSFMVSGVLAALAVRRVDVIVGTSPQFFTACAAYLSGTLKRVPWVFELRDIWPESIRAVGAMQDGVVYRSLERIELFLYSRVKAIVSVTHAFPRALQARGVDGAKMHVVTNGVDLSRFSPRQKDAELEQRLGLQGKFVVGYIGTHGLAHALETVLEAAAALQATPDGAIYRFMLLGDGASKAALQARARSAGLDNVIFIDSVPKDEVVRYWSLLDASLIHLRREPLFRLVIPSKLFESMGMGIPVLHGVEGESADIVEREQVGITFEPENRDALIAVIQRLASDESLRRACAANGVQSAARYDRSALAAEMLRVLEKVAGKSGDSRQPLSLTT